MAEAIDLKEIQEDLKSIKEDLSFIKGHMFDPDCIMTPEESKRFEESLKEFEEGKTTSLSDLKKELGL